MWCAKCGMIADYNQAIREGTVPCNHIWKTGSLDGGIVHHKTFDGKPDRVGEMNANRALAYEELTTHILKRYSELFPNYVWTDATAAVDLMAAEITAQRSEIAESKLEMSVASTQTVDISGASIAMQAGEEPRRGQDLPDVTLVRSASDMSSAALDSGAAAELRWPCGGWRIPHTGVRMRGTVWACQTVSG